MTKAASTITRVSDAQRRALRLIADYPFRVIARPRDEAGYLTINPRTEAALISRGLIRSVQFGRTTLDVGGVSAPVELYVWELTEAGRAILAPVESEPAVIGSSEVEQPGAVEVEASSPDAALRKLARLLGITLGTITTER